MTKFKIGDRVSVYDESHRRRGDKGTIVNVFEQFTNVILDGDDQIYCYHPKQLRRIKSKTKTFTTQEIREAMHKKFPGYDLMPWVENFLVYLDSSK